MTKFRTSKGIAALVVSGSLILAGCGTRQSEAELIKAEGGVVAVEGADLGALGATDSAIGATLPDATGAVAGATDVAAVPGAVAPGAGTAATTNTDKAAGSTTASTGKDKPAAGTSTNAATATAAACTKQLEPIVIGQTLAASGIVGASTGLLRLGLQMWVKDVNARGGVQCHPIVLYTMDDASDPTRVQSNFNELVNNKKAVAIVAAGVPITGAAMRPAAEKAKIPVVGGEMTAPEWTQSTYMFPQGGSPIPSLVGSIKTMAQAAGAKRAGLLYCVEASICGLSSKNWAQIAKDSGVEAGLNKAVSLTQSDYTAECQALKADKSEVVFAFLDASGLSRLVRSCNALGFKPPFSTVPLAIGAQSSSDEALRNAPIYLGTSTVPFMVNDLPAAKAFQDAAKRYAPGQTMDQSAISGWIAGKLFEAALAKVSTEARSGPVTSALIYKGVTSLKNETLGGLAPPLTFPAGKPTPINPCYSVAKLGTDGWTAPQGSKITCIGA